MDVKLTETSTGMIKDIFARYKKAEGDLPDGLTGRTIFHIYAKSDTINQDGDLEGFEDSLFFTLKVFNMVSMSYWEVRNRDSVELDRYGFAIGADIRIFKDGSTMIIVDGDIEICWYQAVEISRPKQTKSV